MEYHKFIAFFSFLSRLAGFQFIEGKGRTLPRPVFKVYGWFTDFVMLFYAFRIISKFFTKLSVAQVLEAIPTFLYVGQAELKSLLLRLNNKKLTKCLDKMDRFFVMVNKRDRELYNDIWKKEYAGLNRFCQIMFLNQVLCLILAYSPSFYNAIFNPSAQFLQFPSVYFFIDYHYAIKVGYLLLDFISSNFCVFKVSAVEMLYLTFLSYYISLLKYLQIKLKQVTANGNKGEDIFWWVETHIEVLSQMQLFKQFVKPLLLVIYIYNLLNIVTATLFVTANGDMDMEQKMVAIVVVTVTMFYFFWDCLLTDQLEALHSVMMVEAYKAELAAKKQAKEKSIFLFSTMRCQKPIRITAGIFTPSCWNFKELLTTTASFLIAMFEVKNRAMRMEELEMLSG